MFLSDVLPASIAWNPADGDLVLLGTELRDLAIALLQIFVPRIVTKTVLPGFALHDPGALTTESFVAPQRIGNFCRAAFLEKNRERDAVFNRLIGALADVWEHGMGSISQQRETSVGP